MEPKFVEPPSSQYNFARQWETVPEAKNWKKMTEEELLAELKSTPDFEYFALPDSWYAKYGLPPKTCMNTKEFLRESPWLKTHQKNYIGQAWIEAKPGGNRPVLPAPEVPTLTIIQNTFSDAMESTGQNVLEGPSETLKLSVCSTEASDSKSQP